VFNDVAVAARLMQAEHHRLHPRSPLLRVLVIDLDVHQGNGTAAIFAGDPSVFTLSLHGARNFPFRKEASTLDVELPDGCGDAEYLAALAGALPRALAGAARAAEAGAPLLAFYVAGADPHEGDRLGRLKLGFAGLAERDTQVFAALEARGWPVAVSMAGGYGRDLADTVAVHRRTLAEAHASWSARQRRAMRALPAESAR
jgi:acetoin utilization deacetylase AcuC-like enzyme